MKQYSRFMAFILATAVTLAVSVGVMAYDDHLSQTLEGYGQNPIMPISDGTVGLSYASSVGSIVISSSSSSFPYSGTYSDFSTSINTSGYLSSSDSSLTASVSSSLSSVTFKSDPVEFPSAGTLLFDVSASYRFYFGYNVSIPTSNPSNTPFNTALYRAATQSFILIPTSCAFYLDSTLVGTFTSDTYNFSFTVDVPVSAGQHVVSLVYSFDSFSKNFSYSRNGTSTNSTNRIFYTSYSAPGSTTYPVSFFGSARSSNIYYSFVEQEPDYESLLLRILAAIQAIGNSQSSDPMRQFENNYLENFGDQIDKTEQALSPANPALPNGGDIGGFVDDISSGLGLSGSSFSSSDFQSATGAFSGAESTGAGGPWEFFTQGVADDLSGDAPMSIDDDYDPILAWFEQAERRYALWSNPS